MAELPKTKLPIDVKFPYFTSDEIRNLPDQTAWKLNQIVEFLNALNV